MATAMKISKFWKALDELIDAGASRHDWFERLGTEWKAVAPYLPCTGSRAKSISCPSPGGNGCPRQIVYHDDGTIRAICGDRQKACRDLTLNSDDVRLHALDKRALASAIASSLSLTAAPRPQALAPIMRIGSRDIQAGTGIPVFLCVPGAMPTLRLSDLDEIRGLTPPMLLLVPTCTSLPDEVAEVLRLHGASILGLDDAVESIAPGQLKLTQHGTARVHALLDRLDAIAQAGQGPRRAWILPAATQWEDLTIRFTAAAWITVTFGGVTRALEPDAFGLKNSKKQVTTYKEAWAVFLTLARGNGRCPVHQETSQKTSNFQKQKQNLSKALREAFGIEGEPIPTKGKEYVTRFVLSGEDLKQGRQGQSGTKFR